MFTQAFNVVMSGVSACLQWFELFADRIGFGGLLLSLFTIATVVRLLLQPIMGHASSDFASRSISSFQSVNPGKKADGRIKGQKALPKGR